MKIDKHLNLVTSLDGAKGRIWVHATPISTEVFDIHWKILSQTFAEVHSQRLGSLGARVAFRFLKDLAQAQGIWEGVNQSVQYVKTGLLAEIHRLTNVMSIGAKGYEMMPFDDAVSTGLLDAEDASEVEGKLVFFTSAFHAFTRATREQFLAPALEIWDAQITPLTCTDFMNSLKTLTPVESSGKSAA